MAAPIELDPTTLQMQERIAWLENALQENNQLLEDMAQRLAKVERQIKVLAQLADTQEHVRPLSEDTRPPHY
ncbi:MAG TPA: SlyX family protein [Candidatus Anaerobiospirillum stercoravium]|nr:SlyX family protein [Candidatus Anaerobiospirillum stercoravium]